ncbi:hypothetical protein [Elongatibacter sediminis]|uniref:Uncharacterized protein n=1 Tax=Elongatibacter sediminis TaxID=3119006 RepID=A0AAW9RNA8_9GAMM
MSIEKFLQTFRIEELCIARDADIRDREITRVEVAFGTGEDDASGYRVEFKLLDQAADAHRYLRRIGPPPACETEWTDAGEGLGEEEQKAKVAALVKAIEGRVDKVHKEQSILHIQPVGKSFLLMGKTRFDVLSDDGKGQLTIRLHREEGVSEAGLNANDLLDGLYTGLITRA